RIDAATLKIRMAAAAEAGEILDKVENIAPWTLHDLRRTATTMLAKPGLVTPHGELPHVLSALLGHSTGASRASTPSPAITAVYNRYDYLAEKRAALEAWAKYVLALEMGNLEGGMPGLNLRKV